MLGCFGFFFVFFFVGQIVLGFFKSLEHSWDLCKLKQITVKTMGKINYCG